MKLLLLLLSNTAWAQPEIICKQPDVRSFQLQIDSERSMTYHYRLLQSHSEDGPLVIYIPGGPGATTIGTSDPRVSPDYSLVLTDPRGAGCNDSKNITVSDISSEKIADDIIELIKDLKPKRYIIHGQSHGSVVATILSSKLYAQKLNQPEAIILEGVFGQYWDLQQKGVGLSDSWSRNFSKLSLDLQEQLKSSAANPFGPTEDQWIGSIFQFTYLGVPSFLPYSRDELLDFFVSNKKGQDLPLEIQNLVASANTKSLPFGQKTWDAIACNELFNADHDGLELKYSFGILDIKIKDFCKKTRPQLFDAGLWQMKHRVVYFIGENDSATPAWQGLTHFHSQSNRMKTGYIVKDAGHRALQLNLRDCLMEIYSAVISDSSLPEVLEKNCAAKAIQI